MAEGREILTARLEHQLGTLVSSVEIAARNNLGSRSVVAETTLAGLLNRVYGWELENANVKKQNCPGIDLIDEDRKIAVQVTATRTVEKVRHTLEEVGRSGVIYKRLIVLVITNQQPTEAMRSCTVLAYTGPAEVWNIPDVFRDASALDAEKLEGLTKYMASELGSVRERVKELRHLNLPPVSALPSTGFVGREAELKEIADRFAQGDRMVVLTGLGGMGKTELAARYGLKHPGLTYFIRFDTDFDRTLMNMVHGIRPKLGELELKVDKAILRKKVLDILEQSTEDDLLIIDNADSPTGVLADLLKGDGFDVFKNLKLKLLLTTRSDAPRSTPVEPMPDEPLFEIFRNHGAELSEAEMKDLIKAVNGHTLTIDLIARTLADNWVPVSTQEMLNAISNSTLSEEDFPEVGTDYNQDEEQLHIYKRLLGVFQVAKVPPLEQQVLRLATLLPETGMDVGLFRKALTTEQRGVFPRVGRQGWLSAEHKVLTIHPIIRLICRTELTPTDADCEAFLDGLWAQYDRTKYRPAQHSQMAELFTVAHDQIGSHHGKWLNRSGIIWNDLGEHQTLHDMYRSRLPALEEALPANAPELAAAYNYSGIALASLGRYSDALAHEEKALEIRRAVLPEMDPDLARSYNNVGAVYGYLGEYRKELEYKQRALAIFEEVLPPDDLDLAISYFHVGGACGHLGDHKRALEYLLKDLTIREKVLSPDHPDLATSYNDVGVAYGALGNRKRALEYQLKAMMIYENVLPEDHPNLAASYNNVGITYGALGDHKRALEYALKALVISEKVLPPDHPDLAQSYNNVGITYGDLGDLKRALEYALKALVIREKVLPPDHPNLAVSYYNAAWAYHELRNLSTAAQYMRRAADIISRSSLPKTHRYRINFPKWADQFEQEAKMEQAIKATMQGFGTTPPPFPLGKK